MGLRRRVAVIPTLAAALALARPADRTDGVEIVVQNDSVVAGSQVAIQAGFDANETAAAWLTSPCDGNIVAVQIFWRSLFGDTLPTVEENITIFDGGMFPIPGTTLQVLEGPQLSDGFLNEFRSIDDGATPLSIPVVQGQVFVVALKFASDPNPLFGPSVVTDTDGCQIGKNSLFDILTGSWLDLCSFGASGDFFIRAVVDCQSLAGACCDADLSCANGVDIGACQGANQTFFANQACAQVVCPEPQGACCLPGGTCEVRSLSACDSGGGIFRGDGVPCGTETCLQACCIAEPGTFCILAEPDDCTTLGGIPQGFGTACSGPTLEECPLGACCLPDGSCLDNERPADCTSLGGDFQGDGVSCLNVQCSTPLGACCLTAGGCLANQEQLICEIFGNTWAGANTICPDDCGPACAGADGDINGDTKTDGEDIQVFVDGILGSASAEEICHGDFDGSAGLNIGDVPGMVAALLAP